MAFISILLSPKLAETVGNRRVQSSDKDHFPMSPGVSERANEGAQRSARAKRAVRSKRMSEPCEQTSKGTSEWPSTVPIVLPSDAVAVDFSSASTYASKM